jgi:hypothetical protein
MLILNQVKRASHFVKITVAGPHRLPKMPESTLRKQARPNNGSLFCSHCAPNVQSGAATYSIGCVIKTKYLPNIGQVVYAKLLAPPDCVFVKHWLRPSLKHKNL